jgi:hypothetical protein
MAVGKAMGPGGRVARAEKKVDKAKGKVSKLVGKYGIASTDGPDVYFKKKEMQAKTAPKIAKAVSKVEKAKSKVEKVVGKKAEKVVNKLTKNLTSDKKQSSAAASYLKSKIK